MRDALQEGLQLFFGLGSQAHVKDLDWGPERSRPWELSANSASKEVLEAEDLNGRVPDQSVCQ
jgi:hypothetical protein